MITTLYIVLLAILLMFVVVAGAWFLFSGTLKKDKKNTDGGVSYESSSDSVTDIKEIVNDSVLSNGPFPGTSSKVAVASNNNEEVINFEENGICYNVTDRVNKTVEVIKGKYTGSIVIPKVVVYNGVVYSVTSIGERALSGCSALTSIAMGNSVKSIGDWAFLGCKGLTSIAIPNSVKSIGKYAFSGCKGLTSITIPNSVTSIGDWAFYKCNGLTSINISNSVTNIGGHAFYECNALTSITIPNSVTSIGKSAFSGCSGLTSIIVDKNNPKYDSRNNCNAIIKTETNELIAGCKNTVVPSSVTSIGYGAFYGCSGLTSITIPNRVTRIGESAFRDCTSLTSITIPNSVTSIGDWAFSGCKGLTSITIPNRVTSIGDYAFFGCSGLENVIKPDGVSIGRDAFKETRWLIKQRTLK